MKAIFLGSGIIHFLNKGCAKIKKKIRRLKVKILSLGAIWNFGKGTGLY
jgi:hypothetical protein